MEALEIEFFYYSLGSNLISSKDFAHMLLLHAGLDQEKYQLFLDRISSKLDCSKVSLEWHPCYEMFSCALFQTISFEEYRQFFIFLNSLEDFTLAMHMYTIAQRPISQGEFFSFIQVDILSMVCWGYTLIIWVFLIW